MTAADLPIVSNANALDDGPWFDAHPDRRSRARASAKGTWLIRRRADVLLRTLTHNPIPPSAAYRELAAAWFVAVYPDLTASAANKRARKARARR
jgi:hypothetical protein